MSQRQTSSTTASGHKKASAWHIARAIAWSFFGVRRRKDHEKDGVHISPIHVIVAGLVGVFVLVGGLMVLVNWVAA